MRYMARAIQRMGFLGAGVFDIGELLRWATLRIVMLFGAALILIGIVLAPLPLPLGLPLIAVGAIIVVNTSTTAKRWFLRWLRRHPGVLRRLRAMTRRRRPS